ncbi:MAG: SDR family oxidoreductase [Candidatus Woesearchaeota archaeon]
MKILVTGGAGFIGSHVVDLLIENGHDVAIVDNLRTGNKENINKKARFYKVDITNKKLDSVFEKESPEIVYHLAAQANVRISVDEPLLDAEINVKGTINILQNCVKHNIKRIIYTSSGGAIYGEPAKNPAPETNPIRPLCPYGLTKYIGEEYVNLYNRLYNLDFRILRYGNVYGPRQDPKGEAGVISIFIGKMMAGEDPLIFGDGNQTRDYVYVGDVARANLIALDKDTENREFNIGFGKETSVNELFVMLKETMFDYLKKEFFARHVDPVPGEVRQIYLDISRTKKDLGWSPEIDLKEGMKRTVDFFMEKERK